MTSVQTSPVTLVNRELGSRLSKYASIFTKYYRKHIAQYALTVGNTQDNTLEQRRQKNLLSKSEFKLKEKKDSVIKKINKSLCSCGIQPHFQNVDKIVDIKQTEFTRRLQGLKSCGSNSACPVCASKLSYIRGNQLSDMLKIGREHNRSYIMVVATVPHRVAEPLKNTLNQVIDMCRYVFKQRIFREFKKITGCRFVHGGLENMVSFKNGCLDWHPHKNYLFDFDVPLEKVIGYMGLKDELELQMYISKMMTDLGQAYMFKNEINKSLLKPYIYQNEENKRMYIKGAFSATVDFSDRYVTKWGLDAEMTSGIYKSGFHGGSFHPFYLLDMIDNTNKNYTQKDKIRFSKIFQDFVYNSKGKQWFYFAKNSIGFYNKKYGSELKVKKDEAELLALEDVGELIYTLSYEEWQHFKPTPKKIAYALSLSDKHDVISYFFTEIEKNRIIESDCI